MARLVQNNLNQLLRKQTLHSRVNCVNETAYSCLIRNRSNTTECTTTIRYEKLPMDVISCEYRPNFLYITYLSEKRVDFRNLLKVLTSIFPCRIELKQIGPREKAKKVGGVGICGQQLCCTQVRGDFDMITISMAKKSAFITQYRQTLRPVWQTQMLSQV